MDIWGVGCVFFEITTLIPLFPGDNETDQINKIHNILGTPPESVLNHFKKHSVNIDFNFPPKRGIGINKYLTHVSAECQDIISKMLTYVPEDRISSKQALNHPYFKELVEQETKIQAKQSLNNFK